MIKILAAAKQKRDEKQRCLTRTFTCSLIILLLFTLGWVMVISMFIGHDMFDFDQMATKPITSGAGVFLALGLLVLLIILCAGYKINTLKQPATWMVVTFGIFTFLFGVIPFYGEAGAISALGRIDKKDLDQACFELNGQLDMIQDGGSPQINGQRKGGKGGPGGKGQRNGPNRILEARDGERMLEDDVDVKKGERDGDGKKDGKDGGKDGRRDGDRKNGVNTRNKYIRMMMNMAAKFDNQAEFVLDQNMCTDVCPCFQTEMWKQKNGIKQYRIDPKFEYSQLNEQILNRHNRTLKTSSPKFTPFVFTEDDEVGVVSFTECFERWVEKAETDKTINLMETFGMTWDELKMPMQLQNGQRKGLPMNRGKLGRGRNGKDGGNKEGYGKRYVDQDIIEKWDNEAMEKMKDMDSDEDKAEVEAFLKLSPEEKMKMMNGDKEKYNKVADSFAIEEFLELDFVANMEEELECSGFCKTALFYWEQDIYKGVPTETCGYAVMDFFRKAAGPLKTECNVVATTCLWLFLLHFTFYGKSKPAGEDSSTYQADYQQPEGLQSSPDPNNRFEMQRMESDLPNEVIMEQHEFNGEPEKTPEELQQDKENEADNVQF